MKFEFSTALSYILPKRSQLSISFIGILAILMISAVVWLSIVFFSVSDGFSKRWSESISSLLGNVRITPTQAYYSSQSYKIDLYSAKSSYKSLYLSEKAKQVDAPYDAEIDPPLPTGMESASFPNPALELETLLKSLKNTCTYTSFRAATAYLEIDILRQNAQPTSLSQYAFLLALDKEEPLSKPAPLTLPLSFKRSGAMIGDRGTIEYTDISVTGSKTKLLPISVQGFFDPGVLPIGGKLVLTSQKVIDIIQPEPIPDAFFATNGYSLWPKSHISPKAFHELIDHEVKEAGLKRYFNVESFERLDFTTELFQQLDSEKNLFRLISLIVMVVACSNIVSLLLILVHSKKHEIAIFRALGASKSSIMVVFVLSGFLIGALGTAIGTLAAYVTMTHIDLLLGFISSIQGHEVLSELYYGTSIPNTVSSSSALFTIISTLAIAGLSGFLSAFSAVRVNVSEALRGEG